MERLIWPDVEIACALHAIESQVIHGDPNANGQGDVGTGAYEVGGIGADARDAAFAKGAIDDEAFRRDPGPSEYVLDDKLAGAVARL